MTTAPKRRWFAFSSRLRRILIWQSTMRGRQPDSIIARPPFEFDDDDPSGGWGLALLVVILIAAVSATIYVRLRL
jgi:hypothetical protein